jgi:hypothetical protein
MFPVRLERQICFMQKHQQISVATSYAWLIDRRGNLLAEAKPTIDIERGMRELNPRYFVELVTPSTIIREQHIQAVGGYPMGLSLGRPRVVGTTCCFGLSAWCATGISSRTTTPQVQHNSKRHPSKRSRRQVHRRKYHPGASGPTPCFIRNLSSQAKQVAAFEASYADRGRAQFGVLLRGYPGFRRARLVAPDDA